MSVQDDKAEARRSALERRSQAHRAARRGTSTLLSRYLTQHRGRSLAGYMPIRTEIDPRQAMASASVFGVVAVPVVQSPDAPLRFCRWHPGAPLVVGAFGAMIPAIEDWVDPEVLIVPMVGFDRTGTRLGYGGGYYDRTLADLRARGEGLAIGFAYAAQEAAGRLPREPTDERVDVIVTEDEVIVPTA